MERLTRNISQNKSAQQTEAPVWLSYQKYFFQEMQHKDRAALKTAIANHDKDQEKILRRRIRERRAGPKGLRALDTLSKKQKKDYQKNSR